MRFIGILLLLTMTSFAVGCATNQGVTVRVIGECAWTRYITMSDEEIDHLLECCRDVAEQISAHNELREENCHGG